MDDALNAWLATSVGQYAQAYAKTSYVLPLHGIVGNKCTCGKYPCGENNKQAGKHPFTRHGLKDASNNIEEIAKLFNYRPELNVGIVTGEISGFFVLDVDAAKNGFESLDKLFQTYGEFEPTVIVRTGGGGVHIWFAYPTGLQIGNRTNFMPGLDIRGQNGYVVAPPSIHVSGKHYELTETSATNTIAAPQWLTDMVQVKEKKIEAVERHYTSGSTPEWNIDEVYRMLDVINPSLGYSDWITVGMGIHDGGYPYEVFDNWSSGGINYEANCCAPHWRSFKANGGISMGSLVAMASLHGWKPVPVERTPVDTSAVDSLVKKAREMAAVPILLPKGKTSIIGFDPMEMPGLIGDTVRWITKHALKAQPELALLNTLAFAGSVFGRRYASPLDTRTNLYMVGVAETGAGKEHSRKAIKELAQAAGLIERIGADAIRSDSGMLRSLMNNSSQLFMIDEFGIFLQGLSNEKSPHYIRSQATILLKLYSASNSIYNHGDYADSKSTPIIINCPNFCVYGTTTEANYAKSLKKAAIESGELNRFVCIRARSVKAYPDKVMPEHGMDVSLAQRWSAWAAKAGDSLGVISNNAAMAPEVTTLKWGSCDDIRYAIQCKQVDRVSDNTPCHHLWDRMFENTVKIAMILAIARDKHAPEFEPQDFDIGQMIVESSIAYQSHLAGNHMGETPQEENNNEIIRAMTEAGGRMGRRDIMRRFRKLKKRDLDDVISGLMEQELVDVEKEADGRGRPKTIYVLKKDESLAA